MFWCPFPYIDLVVLDRRIFRMGNKGWLMCPVCNGKTRTMIYEETTLKYFPLYCPKCKLERIVDVERGKIVKVKDYISLG